MTILNRSESRNGARVIWLAVHSSEGNDAPRVDDAAALRDAAWWTGSSHAITDNDPGSLLTPAQGCVPYERAAWTLRGGNHFSDNIEQVGWAHWTRAEWLARPKLLDNTARWLAERSKARGIPLVKLTPADVAAHRPGVIGHVDYTLGSRLAGHPDGDHTDPGPNYPWDFVLDLARKYAAGLNPQEDELPSVADVVKGLLGAPVDKGTGSVLQTLRDARLIARRAEEAALATEAKVDVLTAKVDALAAKLTPPPAA